MSGQKENRIKDKQRNNHNHRRIELHEILFPFRDTFVSTDKDNGGSIDPNDFIGVTSRRSFFSASIKRLSEYDKAIVCLLAKQLRQKNFHDLL